MLQQLIDKKQEEPGPKTRLLEAGIQLFAEKGYASTSVREIVEKAGVTKPVLYYYFKSKEGLLRAILDEAVAWQEVFIAEVFEKPETSLDRLVKLYRRVYEALMENRDLFKMIHMLIFGLPQGAPDYDLDQFHRRMMRAVKSIYLKGLARGEVRSVDPDDVVSMVLGVTDFCFHLDCVHPGTADPERPERLLRLAFEGLVRKEDSEHEG